jgi:predicted DNA-binding transcriptional regulator AlpA
MEFMMRILSAKQVADITSLSIPQIRRMANQGKLPRPVRISVSRVGWVEDDLTKWLQTINKNQMTGENDGS